MYNVQFSATSILQVFENANFGTARTLGIQYNSNGIWYLYQQFAPLGWTKIRTVCINNHIYNYTCWTQKGRLGLYQILKRNGYLPMIELKG